MRVLVTGGAGLVGSHLVDRLLARGHEVIAVDDLSRGSFANLAHLKREPRFAFAEHDVVRPFRADVDGVFHLAVPSSPRSCEDDPVRAAMTCVAGTAHALEVAADRGARAVLGMSSEVFGPGARCAEAIAADFARTRGVDVRIVRSPLVYGPRMAPDGGDVVSVLALAALSRGGDAGLEAAAASFARTVSLVYVDDAVTALLHAMESAMDGEPVDGADGLAREALAPSTEVSPGDVARAVAACLERDEWPTPADVMGEGVMGEGAPAPMDLSEGVARTVEWFASRLQRRSADRPLAGGGARSCGAVDAARPLAARPLAGRAARVRPRSRAASCL